MKCVALVAFDEFEWSCAIMSAVLVAAFLTVVMGHVHVTHLPALFAVLPWPAPDRMVDARRAVVIGKIGKTLVLPNHFW